MHHTHATAPAPDAQTLREQLSALMDGECSAPETAQLTQVLATSDDWQHTWRQYEAVGYALRAHVPAVGASVPHQSPTDFVNGVMARLQSDVPPAAATPQQPRQPVQPPLHAANDALFRWKMAASVATMAAVLSVAWQVGGVAEPVSATLATAPAPVVASAAAPQWQQVQTQQGTMLRDEELERLMAAHRQYGGMTALQMPAGFLRTATFDASIR